MTLKSRGTELGETRGSDSSGVWESPSIQPPASLLDVCYSTDTPGGGILCRIAGQRLLGPHSCLPPSDYFSQTGAGWEVETPPSRLKLGRSPKVQQPQQSRSSKLSNSCTTSSSSLQTDTNELKARSI